MSYWTNELTDQLCAMWGNSEKSLIEETFLQHGLTWNAVRKKAKRLGLNKNTYKVVEDFSEKDIVTRALQLGYELVKRPQITDKDFVIESDRYDGELVRIGVVSDTHLCSRHQQLTHLKTIYNRFADEGIEMVLHAGDLVEGIRMYRGWEQEVLFHGADKQAEYATKVYPSGKGIRTYIISGNHDASFSTNAGVNVVRRVCENRHDMVYLGSYGAYLSLPGGVRAYLHHGAGGVSYSRSYKIQKAVENFAPENKPHIYISGHYHIACTLPDYRNVFAMHPGAFQSQTEFLRRLGVSPDVGGWILEYRVDHKKGYLDIVELNAKWIPFRKVIQHDY